MKQSVCYMYEYEGNKSTKNVGFLKCIFQKEKIIFQIHGKSLDCDKNMDLEMFLFTSDGETCTKDRVGNVEGIQGHVNYRMTIDDLSIDRMNTYDGILLVSKKQKQYVAQWKRKNISLVERREISEAENTEVAEICEACKTETVGDCDSDRACEVCEMEVAENIESGRACEVETGESGRDCEVETGESGRACGVETGGIFQVSGLEYQKIDRYGISHLPQREWKLANNNFVLHGYHNFKHLMIIRELDQLYLGVPGVYYRKEETAAKTFGFPVFRIVKPEELGLMKEEYSREGTFGYWCRPVLERRRMERRNERENERRNEAEQRDEVEWNDEAEQRGEAG